MTDFDWIKSVTMRRATVADAAPISRLIAALSRPFLLSADGVGAEVFLAAVGEAAIAGYIEDADFRYWLAEANGELAGVVAMRDHRHLYHLFVAEVFQNRGLARHLWQWVKTGALDAGNPGEFTVNASLNAVAVYRRFGFVELGAAVQANGVAFQPMRAVLGSGNA
ncbi:GNAT family N-acetyltransferase [Methylomonas koyamae]|uniref:GNAT family N-acetyltransferase n=1 Tax=Methylomonas koyamae TaxID=702114 RepID=UPI00112D8561|nr:GNAT family N-acetyltransferase [Methylomonas koyamae]